MSNRLKPAPVKCDTTALCEAVLEKGLSLDRASIALGMGGTYLSAIKSKAGGGVWEISEQCALLLDKVLDIPREVYKPTRRKKKEPGPEENAEVKQESRESNGLSAEDIALAVELGIEAALKNKNIESALRKMIYESVYDGLYVAKYGHRKEKTE